MNDLNKIEKILKIDDDVKSEVFDLSEKVDDIEVILSNTKDDLKSVKTDLESAKDELSGKISNIQLLRGDTGEKGVKGDRGEPGYTPIKGKDYFDGKDGVDGRTPTEQELEDIIIPLIPEPDTSTIALEASKLALDELKPLIDENDTPEDIRDKLGQLKGNDRLDAKHIKNLPETQVFRGGGSPSIVAGTNITITQNGNGEKVINTTGGVLTETDPLSLHLDQTTPQTVINGAPIFNEGLKSNGSIILKSGQKLIFDGS